MDSNKKAIFALFAVICCTGLLACAKAPTSPVSETVGLWKLTFEQMQIAKDLATEQSAVQYSGETVVSDIKETPAEGMVFVLVQLQIEKEQAGNSVFSWDQLSIQDESGTKYPRMDNDTFLQNYGYARQKSTDLTLGVNEGYICFELPEAAAAGKLTLRYDSEEATCSIPLN